MLEHKAKSIRDEQKEVGTKFLSCSIHYLFFAPSLMDLAHIGFHVLLFFFDNIGVYCFFFKIKPALPVILDDGMMLVMLT